jgi:hypothetical protein
MGYKYIGGRYAHRVIYERHYGPIPAGWVVHHRDGDPGNNDPANLEAMPRAEHNRMHQTGKPTTDAQKAAASATLAKLRTPKDGCCLQCGAGFVSLAAGRVGSFCSRDCLERWRRNAFQPEQRACEVCRGAYIATKRFQRYCCRACNNRSKVRTYRSQPTGGTPRRTLAQRADVQPDG